MISFSEQNEQFITIKTAENKLFVIAKSDLAYHERGKQDWLSNRASPVLLAAIDKFIKKDS